MGGVFRQWRLVIKLVEVGDSRLGMRKDLVVKRLDLLHRAIDTFHIARMTIFNRPFRDKMCRCGEFFRQ